MVIQRTAPLTPSRIRLAIASLSPGLAGRMTASERILLTFGSGEGSRAIGWGKVARWSPVVTLLRFRCGAYLDQSVIHIMVKYFATDRKQHTSVRRIALFIAQEAVRDGRK